MLDLPSYYQKYEVQQHPFNDITQHVVWFFAIIRLIGSQGKRQIHQPPCPKWPGLSHSKKLNKREEGKKAWSFWLPETQKESFSCTLKKTKRQGRLSMDYSTVTPPPTGMGETKEPVETMRHSLYETLQGLLDPRRGAGRRYPLPVLLCLLCLAKMAGQTTLKGATEWVRLRAEPLATSFGLKRSAMPCQMTYKRMLEVIDAQALNDLLAAFFTRRAHPTALRERAEPLADRSGASGACPGSH
jgi:DDE_Tnp_1-associated